MERHWIGIFLPSHRHHDPSRRSRQHLFGKSRRVLGYYKNMTMPRNMDASGWTFGPRCGIFIRTKDRPSTSSQSWISIRRGAKDSVRNWGDLIKPSQILWSYSGTRTFINVWCKSDKFLGWAWGLTWTQCLCWQQPGPASVADPYIKLYEDAEKLSI